MVAPKSAVAQFPHPLYQALASQPYFVQAADFELASHYLQTDSRAFTTIPGLAVLRHLDFAALSPRYPYLLHGVLAASALYTASSETKEETERPGSYRARAHHHQQLALSSYIRSLNAINDQSCIFVFGFSIILAGIQLAFCASATSDEHSDLQANLLIDNVASIFHLMQGAVAVADQASAWIPGCRTEPLLLPIRTMLQNDNFRADQDINAALDALTAKFTGIQGHNQHVVINTDQSGDNTTVYLSALLQLRGVFGCLRRKEPENFKAAIGWMAFVDRSFVASIKVRQPAALIILAYFGVALDILHPAWWLHGIGAKLVMAADRILRALGAQEWYTFSDWAVSRVWQPGTGHFPRQNIAASTAAGLDNNPQPYSPFEVAYDFTCSAGFVEEKSPFSAKGRC